MISRRKLLTFVVLLCSVLQRSATETYGYVLFEELYAHDFAFDHSGSLYVTGTDVDDTSAMKTVKYGPSGQRIWSHVYRDERTLLAEGTLIQAAGTDSVFVLGRVVAEIPGDQQHRDIHCTLIEYNGIGVPCGPVTFGQLGWNCEPMELRVRNGVVAANVIYKALPDSTYKRYQQVTLVHRRDGKLRIAGTVGSEEHRISTCAVGSDDRVYTDWCERGSECSVRALMPGGDLLWSYDFPPSPDQDWSVENITATDRGTSWVCRQMVDSGSLRVIQLDSDGKEDWTAILNNEPNLPPLVSVVTTFDEDGNFYLAGWRRSNAPPIDAGVYEEEQGFYLELEKRRKDGWPVWYAKQYFDACHAGGKLRLHANGDLSYHAVARAGDDCEMFVAHFSRRGEFAWSEKFSSPGAYARAALR